MMLFLCFSTLWMILVRGCCFSAISINIFLHIIAFVHDIMSRKIPRTLTTLIEGKDIETFKEIIETNNCSNKTICQLRDNTGQSLLHHAVKFNSDQHVDWCLDQGLSISLADKNYITPVTLAQEIGYQFKFRGTLILHRISRCTKHSLYRWNFIVNRW